MTRKTISRACPGTGSGLIRRGLIGGAGIAMLLQAAPAGAQQTDLDALRAQIAELQSRLDKLETAQKTATDAARVAPAPVMSGSKLPVTVSGLLQVNTRNFTNQKGPGASAADTFQLRRGEMRITGNITRRVSGWVMIDPAKQTAATSTSTVVAPKPGAVLPTVTTVTTLNQATNPLQEVALTYLLHQETAPNGLWVDIGQYKIPVGYEGDVVSSSAIPTVDRALMFVARDPFGGGNGDIRESGVRLRGAAGPVNFDAGVFDGLGERQNALAAASPKALIGRLMYSPRHVKGLNLGISGARGNQHNTPAAGSRVQRSLFNAFANYMQDKWTLRAEYLTGKNQVIAAAPGVTRNIRSYYALAGYKFTPKLEGMLRLDRFDFDNSLLPAPGASGDTGVDEITAGVNYYIKGNNAKIQANIVHRNGGAGLIGANGFGSNATGFGKSSTQLRTNFQVSF